MKHLVLVGAGHAHARVLRDWMRAPLPGVELTVVSPTALAPYSGMVPGWLAGAYRFDEIGIDFEALARAAGARFVHDELHALDPKRRTLQLRGGAALGYDLLSLNIGSTLTPPHSDSAQMLSLRPLGRLREAWDAQRAAFEASPSDAPFTVTAVGGGAAGFEALLAVLARLRASRPARPVHGALLTRGTTLLPGLAPGAVRAAYAALARTGVTVQLGASWCDTVARSSDLVLWATGAQAHAWQRDEARRGGLAVSERGFIRVDEFLRSTSHPQIHAVGDCAEWARPLPKAGVYAVRMGPVLSNNLRAALGHGLVQRYRPQHRFLALLASGDGRAIASRGRWSAEGRWLWRWKDHIDRGFLRRFAVAPALPRVQPLSSGDPA
jgi:pyridine nucleotide-disulfide oxidoreductase family protein